MWKLLVLVIFSGLDCTLGGVKEEVARGTVAIISRAAANKYLSTIFLQHGLLQSHFLAIPFPDIPPKVPQPENWINGMHIVKVSTPTTHLDFHDSGVAALCVKARLHLSAKFYFGKHFERVDLIVDVDVKTEVKFVDFVVGIVSVKQETCQSEFNIAKIICPSHLLLEKVRPIASTILATTFPNLLCTVMKLVTTMAKVDMLYTTNVLLPIGTSASIQYQLAHLPLITSAYLALEFKLILRTRGRFITVPVSTVPVSTPSLEGNALSLGLSQPTLDTILGMMIQVQAQEFICTPQVFSSADQLTETIASLLSHQKCPTCPGKSPLKITITLVGTKRIILEPKLSALELSTDISISAKGPTGILVGLFVLRTNLKLSAQASVHDSKLIFTVKLTSIEVLLTSSEVGPIEVSDFANLIKLLLVETFVPHVNEALNVGIPLPSVMHIKVSYPVIHIIQGMLVLSV